MEDWCGGRPDSRSGWSDKRGAAKSWEDTHRETTAAAVSSLINLKQTWAKERRDAKSWRQRIPAEKSRIRWLIVRSKLLVSRRIKIEYIKPVWLFVARSFKTHEQRASTCEFCQMRDVNKTSPKMSGCRGNSLRLLAQVRDYDTFLIINFYWKLRFSK